MSTDPTPHFAVCIKSEGCDDLEPRKLYQILPDEAAAESGLLRVIDESGEDYLYPTENFIQLPLPAAVEQILADLPEKVRGTSAYGGLVRGELVLPSVDLPDALLSFM